MRKLLLLVVCFVAVNAAYAQYQQIAQDSLQNQLAGGLGLNWLNNQPFYDLRLTPDIAFGKVGVGLDLDLQFDAHGDLRKEDFKTASDYIRVIRYLRYGTETDTVFVKLGELDYVTLGDGSIINQYDNSPSFDARRTGMQFNLNFDKYGIQTLYSNFAQAGVVGARAFVKPLQLTSMTDVPILSSFEIGATYATDFDKYATATIVDTTNPFTIQTNGALSIYGGDIDFPLIHAGITSIDVFGDYAKINNFGSGTAAGVLFKFDFPILVNVTAKVERQFNQAHYIPGYFDNLYEIERFDTVQLASKYMSLGAANTSTHGIFGDLLVQVLGTFDILGSFQKLDGSNNSGIFHSYCNVTPESSPIVVRAGYDKVGIYSFQDLITTDDRSLAYLEGGYKPIPYIIVSMMYLWNWTPVYNSGNDITGYAPQRSIQPKVTFVYNVP
jgi:hypothetical protein